MVRWCTRSYWSFAISQPHYCATKPLFWASGCSVCLHLHAEDCESHSMHIAACVQPQKLARLRGAAGQMHTVYAALDWAHADAIIMRQPVDVLVVDPQFENAHAPRTDRIRAFRDKYRALPMVVYSTLTAQTLRPLVDL